MSNSFALCPTDFSRGGENFSRGLSHHWLRACQQGFPDFRQSSLGNVIFASSNVIWKLLVAN